MPGSENNAPRAALVTLHHLAISALAEKVAKVIGAKGIQFPPQVAAGSERK